MAMSKRSALFFWRIDCGPILLIEWGPQGLQSDNVNVHIIYIFNQRICILVQPLNRHEVVANLGALSENPSASRNIGTTSGISNLE